MRLFFFISCLLFLFAACRPQQLITIASPIQNSRLTVDGKLEAWQMDSLRTIGSLPQVRYWIQTDSQFLYVCLRSTGQEAQMLLIQNGMSVWVDTTTRRRNLMGLRYPLPSSAADLQAMQARGGNSRSLESVYTEEMQEFDIVGFSPEPLRATNTASPNFKAATGFDELGELILEYRIPLSSIFQTKSLQGGETFALGIRINEAAKSSEDDDNNQANPMGGGMGGNTMGGGGMGGNPMNGGMGGNGMNNSPYNQNRNNAPMPRASTSMPNVWLNVVVRAN